MKVEPPILWDGLRAATKFEERVDTYKANPTLLDHVRHFELIVAFSDRYNIDAKATFAEKSRKALGFFLSKLRSLESFSAVKFSNTTSQKRREWDTWENKWDTDTEKAISACIVANPLKTIRLEGWRGYVAFLSSMPVSLETLIVDWSNIEEASGIRARPRVIQANLHHVLKPLLPGRVPVDHLSATRTLGLTNVSHIVELQGVVWALPALVCLRVHTLTTCDKCTLRMHFPFWSFADLRTRYGNAINARNGRPFSTPSASEPHADT